MAKKFKYDLDTLEWDSTHRRNKEGVYCYCGLDYNDGDSMLQCGSCAQKFHWDCVACLKSKPLRGDIFYQFKCSVCNNGENEVYERDALSWVQVIYLTLYHMSMAEPDKKYFRWRENICSTINDNWSGLFPDKAKTATWQNTVAGCLSTHSALFKSGFDDTQQTGNWALHEVAEPTRERFKGPTKARDASSKSAKRERPTKKKAADSAATTGAEKEILQVLNEGKAKRTARHRVSFSDDEDEEDMRRRARGKRRRQNMKALEDDSDLLQSVELFTKLEKQRLDSGSNAEDNEGFDVLDECSSLSSWQSDEFDSETKLAKKTSGSNSSVQDAPVVDTEALATDIISPRATDTAERDKGGQGMQGIVGDAERLESVRETTAVDTVEISQSSLVGIAPQPMFDDCAADSACSLMSTRAQWDMSERIGASHEAMSHGTTRRVRRRLQLRRLKRMLGLREFDIDCAVSVYMQQQQRPWDIRKYMDADASRNDVKAGYVATDTPNVDDEGTSRSDMAIRSPAARETLAQPGDMQTAPTGTASDAPKSMDTEVKTTSYMHSFASRLMGRAVLRDSLTAAGPRISPFHGRLLRPFIWRDTQAMTNATDGRARLPMLRMLRAIRSRQHQVFEMHGIETVAQPDHETIDYVYLQSSHIEQVNALLSRTFWPGIDMSEALQYPEFSIVALYGRRVVGCAFLTPDAYLTYIAVAAGWEGAGIAKYMVYHLTQTVPTKDVTLHVAASNVAMLLYQQLGFKPETYAPGFYRAYLPETSRVCPNAFFMRLRRY
ncbi:hypothetical protein GGH96_002294 [Coemansia sp. RSA 1972]|nr:hypothetical protein GGH96_002294 [Coemansia sp. RSA 1972]